jgi:hypothetical protein
MKVQGQVRGFLPPSACPNAVRTGARIVADPVP